MDHFNVFHRNMFRADGTIYVLYNLKRWKLHFNISFFLVEITFQYLFFFVIHNFFTRLVEYISFLFSFVYMQRAIYSPKSEKD